MQGHPMVLTMNDQQKRSVSRSFRSESESRSRLHVGGVKCVWVGEPKIEAQDPSNKRKVRGREKGRVRCGFDVGPHRQEGKKSGSDDDDLSQPGRCVCQAMQGLGLLRRGMFNSIERS